MRRQDRAIKDPAVIEDLLKRAKIMHLGLCDEGAPYVVPMHYGYVLEDGKLKWWRLKTPEREFCFTSKEGFACPETEYEEFTAEGFDGHPPILNNFADAILDGAPLIAPGEEGLNSLNLSNAAYLSSWTDDWAEIPVAAERFEEYLAKLCAREKTERRAVTVSEPAEELRKRWQVRW